MEKKSKYDTNPLDPDYAKRTGESWGETRDDLVRPTEEQSPLYEPLEAPTRRYDDAPPPIAPYQSVFVPPQPEPAATRPLTASPTAGVPPTAAIPPSRQPPPPPSQYSQQPTSRNVAGINVPENAALIVPYIPYYIGGVLALVELLMVPRSEARVRFHAAQGLAMHLFVIAVQTALSVIGSITGSRIGGTLFTIATIIFFAISIIRVWKGEPHHIAPLDEVTKWLNRTLEPQKK